MTEPGTFAMIPALHGEPPLVELLDELAQQERDAFVDEGGLGALFVRAEDCERMLTDRRFGAVAMKLLAFSGVTEGPLHDLWATLMFGKDGDEHRRIRAAAAGFFTRGGVERYRAGVTSHAGALAAALPEGPFDLWDEFALPLASRAACATIGVSASDEAEFSAWSLDLVAAFGVMTPDAREQAESAAVRLCAYLDDLFARSQGRPGDDLLSAILANPDLTYQEKRGLALNVAMGGLDAMAKAITTGTLQLLERGMWRALADSPDLMNTAVDELLRLFPATILIPRVAMEPVHYGGVDVQPGQMALCSLRSACQDPALFERPTELDIRRPAGKPFVFGAGPHFCLGAHLARVVIGAGLRALLARAPALRLADGGADVRWGGAPFYGVERLLVQH